MKQTLNFLVLLLLAFSLNAQSKMKMPSKFELVVSFGSMGAGTPTDAFLKDYVKKFNKKYKVSVPGYKASGCGREGEFNILLSLSALKGANKKKFISELRTLVSKQELKNKAKDPNIGSVSIDRDKELSDYSFCRGGVAKW